jgi:uncharacterized protein YndB with AHSA1/START domain
MARNSRFIAAPPAAVWSVLEDAYCYPRWIVGSDRTLSADAEWPEPGSQFRVRLPLGFTDSTRSRELDRGRRIVLDAAAGIFGPARVTITTEAERSGTCVTMIEDPAGKVALLRYLPPVHLLLRLRNVESLRRLSTLVEGSRDERAG